MNIPELEEAGERSREGKQNRHEDSVLQRQCNPSITPYLASEVYTFVLS